MPNPLDQRVHLFDLDDCVMHAEDISVGRYDAGDAGDHPNRT